MGEMVGVALIKRLSEFPANEDHPNQVNGLIVRSPVVRGPVVADGRWKIEAGTWML